MSCLNLVGDAGGPNQEPGSPAVEPQPPVTIIDGMDPNECNWVHNINACSDTGSGSVETDRMPGPGIAVGEPYPLPNTKGPKGPAPCGPDEAIAVTSEGQVSCLNLVGDAGGPS